MAVTGLSHLRCFLLDLDGTLYLGSRLFDGTRPFLAALRRTGRRYLFLTNNSSYSTEEYCEKLRRFGIDAAPDDVFSSTRATIGYLREQKMNRIYALATPAVEREFSAAGFELADDTADTVDAVVLTFDKTLTYGKLLAASRLLLRGVPFIATHPDRVCPTESEPIPDCGAMIELLRSATGRKPVVIGKPSAHMAAAALAALHATADETAMVGDRIYTDMKMAQDAGLTGILVLSGEATRAQAEEAGLTQHPKMMVCADVAELARRLETEERARV